jgi:hypothetical protein
MLYTQHTAKNCIFTRNSVGEEGEGEEEEKKREEICFIRRCYAKFAFKKEKKKIDDLSSSRRKESLGTLK